MQIKFAKRSDFFHKIPYLIQAISPWASKFIVFCKSLREIFLPREGAPRIGWSETI